jgi:hypothetical protein
VVCDGGGWCGGVDEVTVAAGLHVRLCKLGLQVLGQNWPTRAQFGACRWKQQWREMGWHGGMV